MKELLQKRAKLIADARAIYDLTEKENRALTAEERTTWEKMLGDIEALTTQITDRARLDAMAGVTTPGTDGYSLQLPHNEARNLGKYSVLRAIRMCAEGRTPDGLEGECSAELIALRGGRQPNGTKGIGFVMPMDLPIDHRSAAIGRRGLSLGGLDQRTFGTVQGVGAIFTAMETPYIELLRNRMVVRQAGARVLTGMVGPFAIPRQSATGTMYWLAEGGSPTGSQPAIDQVLFTPRTAGAYTDISRKFMLQTSLDAEMFVRDDLATIVALGIDLASLNGAGSGAEPLGIMQNPSVPVTAIGTNGGVPTWAAVVALETAVSVANADVGSLSYMTNAKVRGKMKTTLKDTASTGPIYLWDTMAGNPTPLNGYNVNITNQLPSNLTKGSSGAVCSPLLFGNWADMIIAFWSGQDVIVDPYSLSTSGGTRIVVLQDCDVNIRHPESFAMILDLTT